MSVKPIRNIIFDLGGVILNIDPQLTVDALRNLGWNNFYEANNQPMCKELFYNLEKGSSSPEAFRDNVRHMIASQKDDAEIDHAWTAMILDIPADRVRYLEELKKSYRIFLLSNTNEIHRAKFHRDFEADFGYSFYDLFERSFYSHEMGMRKPNPQIYLRALNEAGLIPEETLFIDDMEENIAVAKTTGMKVLHIQAGTLMESLPNYLEEMG
jgi:HAD superfamily hydrolase (TIGR01509 family)